MNLWSSLPNNFIVIFQLLAKWTSISQRSLSLVIQWDNQVVPVVCWNLRCLFVCFACLYWALIQWPVTNINVQDSMHQSPGLNERNWFNKAITAVNWPTCDQLIWLLIQHNYKTNYNYKTRATTLLQTRLLFTFIFLFIWMQLKRNKLHSIKKCLPFGFISLDLFQNQK